MYLTGRPDTACETPHLPIWDSCGMILPKYLTVQPAVLAELNRKSIYCERSEETLWRTKRLVEILLSR